jgi:hypothetical protein
MEAKKFTENTNPWAIQYFVIRRIGGRDLSESNNATSSGFMNTCDNGGIVLVGVCTRCALFTFPGNNVTDPLMKASGSTKRFLA